MPLALRLSAEAMDECVFNEEIFWPLALDGSWGRGREKSLTTKGKEGRNETHIDQVG